jgi:hypothetical protein
MLVLLLCTPLMPSLVDNLEISPTYAISAVYYAEGERVSSDVMTLDLDDWIILKLAYEGHASAASESIEAAGTLIAEVCKAQCPPCVEITPAARVRIDELMDLKEAISQQLNETERTLTTWRVGSVIAGVVLTAALVLTIAY